MHFLLSWNLRKTYWRRAAGHAQGPGLICCVTKGKEKSCQVYIIEDSGQQRYSLDPCWSWGMCVMFPRAAMFMGWQGASGLVQTWKSSSLAPEGSAFSCMRLRNKHHSVSRKERQDEDF